MADENPYTVVITEGAHGWKVKGTFRKGSEDAHEFYDWCYERKVYLMPEDGYGDVWLKGTIRKQNVVVEMRLRWG